MAVKAVCATAREFSRPLEANEDGLVLRTASAAAAIPKGVSFSRAMELGLSPRGKSRSFEALRYSPYFSSHNKKHLLILIELYGERLAQTLLYGIKEAEPGRLDELPPLVEHDFESVEQIEEAFQKAVEGEDFKEIKRILRLNREVSFQEKEWELPWRLHKAAIQKFAASNRPDILCLLINFDHQHDEQYPLLPRLKHAIEAAITAGNRATGQFLILYYADQCRRHDFELNPVRW